ncbi:MAG: sugar ABC transporter ATP-binding protein [Planctomycetes bacterium]|nr:sugar ABC transporter ATP-binding protein [Planctomycetota bacterium]
MGSEIGNRKSEIGNPPPPPLLEMRRIHKGFPGVQALRGVDLEVRAGEVHCLVGENGAGKSTLMKCLMGVYRPDAGDILLAGRHVAIHSPHQALGLGISMVFQELNLVPALSVAENVFLGREPLLVQRLGIVDWRTLRARTREVIRRFGFPIEPDTPVSRLSRAKRQLVEITKALVTESKIVIMDEPTASLSLEDTQQLFGILRRLRSEGVAIVYISHRLEELRELGDRVTILRDGERVYTGDVAATDLPMMIRHMVGRELTDMYPKEPAPLGPERLRVEGLSARNGRVRNVSLRVRAGEILGIAGLVGAGRTELAEALFGVAPIESGRVLVDGVERRFRSPHDAIGAGLGLLTEDRKGTGLLLNLPLPHNTTLAALGRLLRGFHLPLGAERRVAQDYVARLGIRTPSVRQLAVRLSGGNQQKVVLAKWLYARSQILIFDEPTLGIDVGAKVEVYHLLCELARQGAAIVMISSDLPELLAMSDTLLAMRRGEVTATLDPRRATQEEVLRYMALGADAAPPADPPQAARSAS